jgi:hypothetical protein
MRYSIALASALVISAFLFSSSAAAAPECIRYVPAVGKLVAVECGDAEPPPAPLPPEPVKEAATEPAPAPQLPAKAPAAEPLAPGMIAIEPVPAPPSAAVAAELDPFTPESLALQEKVRTFLIDYTQLLTAVNADAAFRDKYCLADALEVLSVQEGEARKKKKLLDMAKALDVELGPRGAKLFLIRKDDLAKLLLSEYVEATNPYKRMKHTPIGIAFIKARNEMMQMSCQCMRSAEKAENIVCCDRCDQNTLQSRFNEKFSSR